MFHKQRLLGLAALCAVLAPGCSTDDTAGVDDDETPAEVVIDIVNRSFRARTTGTDAVTISLGQSVRWVNQDDETHHPEATAAPAGSVLFDSGDLSPDGGTFAFSPDRLGTWTYRCQIHPEVMFGATITVVQ